MANQAEEHKRLSIGRATRFSITAGAAGFLFWASGTWNAISGEIFDITSAAIAASAITLTLACLWATASRSREQRRKFGWFGYGLDPNDPELKIGWFVRMLCGVVSVISLVPAVGLAVVVMLKLLPPPSNIVSLLAISSICFVGGIFLAYIAILGRVYKPRTLRQYPMT